MTENATVSRPVEGMVSLRDAVTFDLVNGKEVPVLIFPDRTRIHLAPYTIPDGGQDPTNTLQRWLIAWCRHIAREPLSDAWSDLAQWARMAEWQREELAHDHPVCPNKIGIETTLAIKDRISTALRAMRRDEDLAD